MPAALATELRVRPVATLRAVTVAPGTAAWVSSKMRPSMLPVSDCARALTGSSSRPAAASIATAGTSLLTFILDLPVKFNLKSLETAWCVAEDMAIGMPAMTRPTAT